MHDNELIIAFSGLLEEASAMSGWNYQVIQQAASTQEGIPSTPTIFFQKLFDDAHGWPAAKNVYDRTADKFNESSTQVVETTMQVSALVIQDPMNLTLPTASDVVNYMHLYLSSRPTIKRMLKMGFSQYRVKNVRNPYFEDDRHRFEANPSFDVVLTHERQIIFDTPAVHVVEGALITGIYGQGTFPIPDNPPVETP